MKTRILDQAHNLQEQLIHWRRDIHMHPEIGFHEHRTARLVADTLQEMGLDVETGIGKTGVVARLGSGTPAVGLRADMDALRIQEANDVPYASRVPGLMHACGHDAHTAMLLGAARILSQDKNRPSGEIRFLFQPSEEGWDEEGKGGAKRMMEDGALQGLNAIFALHVDSTQPSGTIGIREGVVMAGVHPYDAVIFGTSSHSAAPHQGVNPVLLLAHVIEAIQAIPANDTPPLQPAIISCESVQAASSSGVIPDRATLHGNIRFYDRETRQAIQAALERAFEITRTLGGNYELSILEAYPPTYNDHLLSKVVRQVAVEMIGERQLYRPGRSLAGEDFGDFAAEIPGAYFNLGVGLEDDFRPYHNPHFDIDESALPAGCAVLAGCALHFLETDLPSPEDNGAYNKKLT